MTLKWRLQKQVGCLIYPSPLGFAKPIHLFFNFFDYTLCNPSPIDICLGKTTGCRAFQALVFFDGMFRQLRALTGTRRRLCKSRTSTFAKATAGQAVRCRFAAFQKRPTALGHQFVACRMSHVECHRVIESLFVESHRAVGCRKTTVAAPFARLSAAKRRLSRRSAKREGGSARQGAICITPSKRTKCAQLGGRTHGGYRAWRARLPEAITSHAISTGERLHPLRE